MSTSAIGIAAKTAIRLLKFSLISSPNPLFVTAPTLPATSCITNNGTANNIINDRSHHTIDPRGICRLKENLDDSRFTGFPPVDFACAFQSQFPGDFLLFEPACDAVFPQKIRNPFIFFVIHDVIFKERSAQNKYEKNAWVG
jgi:hypothetical protein